MIEGEETPNCEIPNLQKFPMPETTTCTTTPAYTFHQITLSLLLGDDGGHHRTCLYTGNHEAFPGKYLMHENLENNLVNKNDDACIT